MHGQTDAGMHSWTDSPKNIIPLTYLSVGGGIKNGDRNLSSAG